MLEGIKLVTVGKNSCSGMKLRIEKRNSIMGSGRGRSQGGLESL